MQLSMQSWTPIGHVRSIGAWPALLRTQHYVRSNHVKAHWKRDRPAPRRADDMYTQTASENPESDHMDLYPKPRPSSLLPRPPSLHLNDPELDAQYERKTDRIPRKSIFRMGKDITRKDNLKHAPFSTLFAENPYAQALATPVRMDCFSKRRMPAACMISFHSVASTEPGRHSILPLSLAAALIPKAKNWAKLTDEERQAIAVSDQEYVQWGPQGVASWVMGKIAAVALITKDPPRRVRSLAQTPRIRGKPEEWKLDWRADMPRYVLELLRRLVAKRLRSLALQKTPETIEKPGLISALPGQGDTLERLDQVPNVLCVLRLKPKVEKEDEIPDSEGEVKPRSLSDILAEATELGVRQPSESGDQIPQITPSDLTKLTAEYLEPSEGVKKGEIAHRMVDVDDGLEEDALPIPTTTQAFRKKTGPWREKEPLHCDIYQPLASQPRPVATYFPTMPYRNRRVPVYNLPYLLGLRHLKKALDGSACADCTFLTVSSGAGSAPLQIWLLKLAAYVAEGKSKHLLI